MKNVYRFLVGCIVCFFMIVLFGTVREQRVMSVATYARVPIEELLSLPMPSQKQWSDTGSLASYVIETDAVNQIESIGTSWTSKLGPLGWKIRKSTNTVYEWVKGDDYIFLSHAAFLKRTVAVVLTSSDIPAGPSRKQVLDLDAS